MQGHRRLWSDRDVVPVPEVLWRIVWRLQVLTLSLIHIYLFYLPVDENNLACRAAKMLIDEFNITEGVHISMDKKIPVSAGMAGGSADAAAVLFGVNKMFELGLSMTELEEREMCIRDSSVAGLSNIS